MLKVYTVKSYVSINGGDWQRVGHSGHIMTDNNPTEKVILNNATFDECYKYVSQHPLDGIYLSSTFFKNKPAGGTLPVLKIPRSIFLNNVLLDCK